VSEKKYGWHEGMLNNSNTQDENKGDDCMCYKIEKGVPVPPLKYKTQKWLDLYDQMEIGDSYLFEDYFKSVNFRGAVYNYRGSGHLKSHILNKDNHVRIWRVKKIEVDYRTEVIES
jgi:hypothetical protein